MPSSKTTSLVICDLQPDLLGSIPEKETLLTSLKILIEIAQKRKWLILYSGLKFQPGYQNVSESHKLYGALKKLNSKLGDKAVHWFMEGYPGCEFHVLQKDDARVRHVWRSSHCHDNLVKLLKEEKIEEAYIVGIKASGSVQHAMQSVMNTGIVCTAIPECIKDDDNEKCEAILRHLLPVYGNVTPLQDIIHDFGMDELNSDTKEMYIDSISNRDTEETDILYATDCNRRGHGARYIELLMQRGNWKMYPNQIWYEDFIKGEFYCPLGKKVVDFCDEPDFSKVSMYLAGRDHLDEKDKVIEIAGKYMPKTYCIENGEWIGDMPPSDEEDGAISAPWFIKEADKNLGGAAIVIVAKPSEIMNYIVKDKRYVVQQHIRDPLLTDDGRKTHLKFYVLLIGEEDGITWNLYTYKGALLSISPHKWSATDLSQDTQVTIHRHPQHPAETEGWKQHWDSVYSKCKEATGEVIENAIQSKKLRGRSKKQYEVFSVDWMPDAHGNIWMFEFNLSPAVAQPEFDDPTSRDSRRDYLMKHDESMLKEALDIVFPWEENKGDGEWDFVKNIVAS